MSNILHFRWGVDTKGYDLVEEPEASAKSSSGDAFKSWAPEVYELRPRSGKFRHYTPRELAPNLHREFAYIDDNPADLGVFVSRFGNVTGNDFEAIEQPCAVESALELRRNVRRVMDEHESGGDPIEAYYAVAQPLATFMIDNRNPYRPTMNVVPQSLGSYIWLRVVEDITGNVQWIKCEYCSTHFPVGRNAGTKRRRFCSNKCRVYWNRKHGKGKIE